MVCQFNDRTAFRGPTVSDLRGVRGHRNRCGSTCKITGRGGDGGRRNGDTWTLPERLGADRIINYEDEDFTEIGETFDLVFDAVGKTSWFACRKLLNQNGIFAATDLGPLWSNILLGMWFGITGSRRVRVPYPKDAPGFVRHLAELMAEGRFRGVFDRSFPLEDIVEAFRYVETGQKTGIVVINIQ